MMGLDGKWERKNVDRLGYLCYIGTRWDEYSMQMKDIILKEALEEKIAETAHVLEQYGGDAPA